MTEIEQNSHSCTFEAAFLRLEEILDKMNSNEISLGESLTLYEEADRLIAMCSKKLNEAERKVEILHGDMGLICQTISLIPPILDTLTIITLSVIHLI